MDVSMTERYIISENFMSIQGEGRYAGTPSLWVRTFGCNLKCPGFPCDTEYSWNSNYKDDALLLTADEIYQKLKSFLVSKTNPNGLLYNPVTLNRTHLVFTGGEPLLLKYQRLMRELLDLFKESDNFIDFTIETNGTQMLSTEFRYYLRDVSQCITPFMSISPKLYTVSGEKDAIKYDVLETLMSRYKYQLKFVADDTDECENELLDVLSKIKLYDSDSVWVMPKGETREDQLNVASIVERYQALGFKIATRNHCYIWSNDKGR
jgi:organic radical activating enzyme